MLHAFRNIQSRQSDLHYSAIAQIRNNLDMVDDAFLSSPDANALFIDILSDPDAERALRRMQKIGFLQKFVPVYDEIDSLMQFNASHAYTVDEHHFIAIGHIHKMRQGSYALEAPQTYDAITHLSDRDLQVVCFAAFLHDTAKARPGKHIQNVLPIIQELGPRFGFSPQETETITWLCEQHMFLYNQARLPYHDDPTIDRNICATLESVKKLNMLHVLTVCDSMAAGSKRRLDPLKLKRLEDLYTHCKPKLRSIVLPEGYKLGEVFVQVAKDSAANASVITVISPDKPFLLSNLTGCISENECDIRGVSAHPFTDDNGQKWVSDKITVTNSAGLPIGKNVASKMVDSIHRALTLDMLADFTIASKISAQIAEQNQVIEPDHYIDIQNDLTEDTTVIDVGAPNRPGLLHTIIKTVSNDHPDLTFQFCHAHSEPGSVLDTFIIQTRDGGKVSEDQFSHLENSINAAVLSTLNI